MKKLSCSSCGAPIDASICKYCRCEIEDEKLNAFNKKDEWLNIYDTVILNKIQNGQKLTDDEDKVFYYLLKYGLIPDDKLETDLIIYYAHYGNKLVSYDTFEEFMTSTFEKFMRQLNFDRIKNYNFDVIVDKDKDSENDGCEIFASIFVLKQERLKELYEGNLYGLVVLYHELWHGFQEIGIRSGQINSELMLMIKDIIIRKYSDKYSSNDEYYNMNYRNISFEIDAQDKAIQVVKKYIDIYKLGVTDDTLSTIRNLYGKDIFNTNRVVLVDGKEQTMTLDEIFDDLIKTHPELLQKYPQLNVEYLVENNSVRRKNIEELKELLEESNNELLTNYISELIQKESNVRN